MASTVELAKPPLVCVDNLYSSLSNYRLLSAISRKDNKTFLHFPYPYIPSGSYTRPPNGYRLDTLTQEGSLKALFVSQQTGTENGSGHEWGAPNTYEPWISQIDNAGNVLGISGGSFCNFITASEFQYVIPASIRCIDRIWELGGIHETSIESKNPGQYKNYDFEELASRDILGLRMKFSISDSSISSCHATFYYLVEMNSVDGNDYPPTQCSLGFCRYKSDPTDDWHTVPSSLSHLVSRLFTYGDRELRIDLMRIAWNSPQQVQPLLGDCEIELPCISFQPRPSGNRAAFAMPSIQSAVVFM